MVHRKVVHVKGFCWLLDLELSVLYCIGNLEILIRWIEEGGYNKVENRRVQDFSENVSIKRAMVNSAILVTEKVWGITLVLLNSTWQKRRKVGIDVSLSF